jgi:hypothetical protein
MRKRNSSSDRPKGNTSANSNYNAHNNKRDEACAPPGRCDDARRS